MKNIKKLAKLVLCCAICVVLAVTTAACGESPNPMVAYEKGSYNKLNNGAIIENSRFALNWNTEDSTLVLFDKQENKSWSYVPFQTLDDSYILENCDAELQEIIANEEAVNTIEEAVAHYKKNLTKHPVILSAFKVFYYEAMTLYDKDAMSHAQSVNKGSYSMKVENNVLTIVYYFDKYEFAIPIQFALTDKGLQVSIDTTNIKEGKDYILHAIELMPFFTSVANDKAGDKNYYLFVPSGSGTIVYPQPVKDSAIYQSGYNSTEPVYGGDYNVEKEETVTETQAVRLPVFGAVNNDRAMAAIITEGAECASLKTVVGNQLSKYSYVGATFVVRGYQDVIQKLFTSQVKQSKIWTDAYTPTKMSILFTPLYGEDSSYVGIANTYREYLQNKGLLKTTTTDEKLVNVKFYGGMSITKFFAGVPYNSVLAATTVKQATDIIKELEGKTGTSLNANLIGFGNSGIDIMEIAGGYGLNGNLGSKKDLVALAAACKESGTNLFYNFDMLRYSESGSGISYTYDRAKTANKSYTLNYYTKPHFRTNDKTTSYVLVGRSHWSEISEKMVKAIGKWQMNGISLDTLSSMLYSDYNKYEHYGAANYDKQTSELINGLKSNGLKFASSEANAFAAALSDQIYDAPTNSSKYRFFGEDVPFYQMVFKGYVPMSGTSLNMSVNKNEQFLKCVESGIGLTYSLIGTYSNEYISSHENVFYGSVYADNKDEIVAKAEEYKAIFESVNGQTITTSEIVADDVHKTVFANGVVIYVNYSNSDYETADGIVTAGGYLVK